MAHYHIWTIGCQMNKADSEQLAAYLERLGYRSTSIIEEADVIVLNSCMVRQSAENRVISKLESLVQLKKRHQDAVVALAGCMVDDGVMELRRRFPQVDLFLKPGQFDELYDLTEAHRPKMVHNSFTQSPSQTPGVFVTIIEGCSNFCSYCIVPYRRGRERSRPIAEICSQIEGLVRNNVKEVTLLGQNVDSYGYDLPGGNDLADLLRELNRIEGLERIRFLTSHPKYMTQKLIQAVASLDKVCEHISLPVQAGDDDILRQMKRGYNVEYYRQLVECIRSIIPGVAVSSDVIVGFPGETGEQFQGTIDLLYELRFDTVHVAAYSPRPGTLAARSLKDNVPISEKKERLRRVEELQREIASEINALLLDQTVEIMVEAEKRGKWQGRTRTGKLVFFSSSDNCLGRLVEVRIDKTSPWALQGTLANVKHVFSFR